MFPQYMTKFLFSILLLFFLFRIYLPQSEISICFCFILAKKLFDNEKTGNNQKRDVVFFVPSEITFMLQCYRIFPMDTSGWKVCEIMIEFHQGVGKMKRGIMKVFLELILKSWQNLANILRKEGPMKANRIRILEKM